MRKLSILVFVCMIAQATLNAQVIDDNGATSISRVSFTVYENSYSIDKYKISKDEKGNTSIIVFGSGFAVLPFRNGSIQIPVWCNYISGGKVISSVSAASNKTSVTYYFESTAVPETLILYPADNQKNETKIKCK